MGKRYYCEFCDRFFRDTLAARKSHNESASHVEKRRRHYFDLKPARERLEEVRTKERCLDFYKHGLCRRGEEKCKFVHISKDDYKKLMDEAKKERGEEEERKKAGMNELEFDLENEELDPYDILNAFYRKKGVGFQTKWIDGNLVDVKT